MRRALIALGLVMAVTATTAVACWPGEPQPPKERQAPVAQTPMLVDGEVVAVDVGQQTFTVMTKPKHRQPAGKVVVGINRDTKMVKDELALPKHLKVGDTVVVQGQRGAPLGVALFTQGQVTQLSPLTVQPAKEVRVVMEPGAELSFLRLSELKLEDLAPGLEVQAIAWRGDEPVVAKEVHAFFVLPGARRPAATGGQETAPPSPGTGASGAPAGEPAPAPSPGEGKPPQ